MHLFSFTRFLWQRYLGPRSTQSIDLSACGVAGVHLDCANIQKHFPLLRTTATSKNPPKKYPLLPAREKLVPWPSVDRAAGEMDSQGSLSQAATLDRTRPPQSKRAQQTCSPVEEDYALLTFPSVLSSLKVHLLEPWPLQVKCLA